MKLLEYIRLMLSHYYQLNLQTIDSPIGKDKFHLINDEFLIQVNERLRIFFPLK